MTTVRIALANLPHPARPDHSVALATGAIEQAARAGALVVAFPECFVPGYRLPGRPLPPPDAAFLERAWSTIARCAADHR
ncbi:MAG: carbon-nitrogen hydrolase family protein, partial [Gemmatimonadetes bacterium]|nr:carbon-nitrogen hydrolase family protein [Gemmatimonadota bacterium]